MTTKTKSGVILLSVILALCLLTGLYSVYSKHKIRKRLKLGVANVYKTDNDTRYRHYRIWYTISIDGKIVDSSFSIRDDIPSATFVSLTGKQLPIVFDSTNPRAHNHLLITTQDFDDFDVSRQSATGGNK